MSASGKFETRYLEFEFHRVRVDGKITHVLVSVSDVTRRVDLARELQISQSQAQAQVDTLLGILHVDPAQLASFLSDSDAAMKMINAVLREPAREEGAFRKKLDTLFRQAHSVKGEAAALGLSSIESRAHAFEDDLKALREKPELSGNDFLPLVIKLDDLLTHLQSISDLVSRLSQLQVRSARSGVPRTDRRRSTSRRTPGRSSATPTRDRRCSSSPSASPRENDKEAALQCVGLDSVPDDYRRVVKDIAMQAVRNAIVHGIEPRGRAAVGGQVAAGSGAARISGVARCVQIHDRGRRSRACAPNASRRSRVQKGFLTAEQAASLDAKQTFSLLFQPGFSTVENATKDAGRGVGMNLIADLMREIGGRVGVATSAGQIHAHLPCPCRPPPSASTSRWPRDERTARLANAIEADDRR